MTRYILINGVRREMTTEEENKFNQDVEETNSYLEEKQNAETQKENKKASGKQKLKDLGLDDDEIQALIGV
jgi:hypothetical protein|tara:strand:+ start:532 stop:744 length:213 start_codon:yes stop_codon:yes gene_type:complete